VDYETNEGGHLTSAHLTTDGGQLSITLAPAGIVVTVFNVGPTGLAVPESIHVEREDIGGIIDVLADFLAALEEVE
jgi:hypothetical protein